jgi:hypothetical protein
LVECLRNALSNDGRFGCSIDPRQENLARAGEFLASTKLTGRAFRDGLQTALGVQDINVFGIDPGSHAASILVEADYRMKCIALGVEKSIADVPSYWDRLDLDESLPQEIGLARWWFTVKYSAVVSNADQTVFEIRGPGVQVLSEDELLGQNGRRIHTGKSTGANKSFADDFTRHFDQMCQAKPVFAELRNVFDMALISAILAQKLGPERIRSSLDYFAGGDSDAGRRIVYQTRQLPQATTVDSVINHRTYETRSGGRRQRHLVVAVGGGVDFDAKSVLKERLTVADSAQVNFEFPTTSTAGIAWWQD